ncbi:MAG: hypothetical protein NT165_01625 [Candidatus Falkowbacteria bacterium]|nr:hypothetical protein [Candidatus Falkowbacteria bacterium]
MINWQNRQHRMIIIVSAALVLLVIAVLMFLSLRKNSGNQAGPNQSGTQNKNGRVETAPVQIVKWREQEVVRLAKANHDKILYQEILASKDSGRCKEMQNLDGEASCLLSLALDLNDASMCDKISQKDFADACKEKYQVKK